LLFENNNKSLLQERNKQHELLHDYTIKGKESLRAAGRSPKGRRRRRRGETNIKKKEKKHHEHAVWVSTISNNWFIRMKKTERKLEEEEEAQSLWASLNLWRNKSRYLIEKAKFLWIHCRRIKETQITTQRDLAYNISTTNGLHKTCKNQKSLSLSLSLSQRASLYTARVFLYENNNNKRVSKLKKSFEHWESLSPSNFGIRRGKKNRERVKKLDNLCWRRKKQQAHNSFGDGGVVVSSPSFVQGRKQFFKAAEEEEE
jgi:hypothetical protein